RGLDVVVDLLPSQPKLGRQGGRGVWLGQLREHPGPDRIERDLRGGGVLDHGDIVHAANLSPNNNFVKAVKPVGRAELSAQLSCPSGWAVGRLRRPPAEPPAGWAVSPLSRWP